MNYKHSQLSKPFFNSQRIREKVFLDFSQEQELAL